MDFIFDELDYLLEEFFSERAFRDSYEEDVSCPWLTLEYLEKA